MKRIAVFCGARVGAKPSYEQKSRELGELMAKANYGLIYGGASVGLMGAVADAVLKHNGEVVGVLPRMLSKRELAHDNLKELHIVDTMHERKALMHQLSDAFIALPGGIGTLEEFFEIFTWYGIGEHQKPCCVLNIDHYYDPLLSLLDHMVTEGFLSKELREIIFVAEEPKEMLAIIDEQLNS